MCDVTRLGKALGRGLGERRVENLLRQRVRHVGHDHAWRDGVDGHPLGAQLLGRGLGQPDQPRLGGAVVGLAELATQAVDRGDVDDSPMAGGAHARRQCPDGVERAGQVDRQHRLPLLVAHLGQASITRDASVVDQQRRMLREPCDRGSDALRVGHVDLVAGEGQVDLGHAEVERMHLGTGLGQRLGDGAADATRAAGDHRGTAAEVPARQCVLLHRGVRPVAG